MSLLQTLGITSKAAAPAENQNPPAESTAPNWDREKAARLMAAYGVQSFVVTVDGALLVAIANTLQPVVHDGAPVTVLCDCMPDIAMADDGAENA